MITQSITSPLKRIVLVRHGPTEWSKAGRYTGRTDIPLTSDAQLVATKISTQLYSLIGNDSIDHVDLRTSPLKRAIEMAILTLPSLDLKIDPLLIEWNYGDYEGLTIEQIRSQVGNDWSLIKNKPPNGESVDDLLRRCDDFSKSLTKKVTICFSHGHFLKILLSYLLINGPDLVESVYLAAGGYCVLDVIDSKWHLTMLENGIDGSIPGFI